MYSPRRMGTLRSAAVQPSPKGEGASRTRLAGDGGCWPGGGGRAMAAKRAHEGDNRADDGCTMVGMCSLTLDAGEEEDGLAERGGQKLHLGCCRRVIIISVTILWPRTDGVIAPAERERALVRALSELLRNLGGAPARRGNARGLVCRGTQAAIEFMSQVGPTRGQREGERRSLPRCFGARLAGLARRSRAVGRRAENRGERGARIRHRDLEHGARGTRCRQQPRRKLCAATGDNGHEL